MQSEFKLFNWKEGCPPELVPGMILELTNGKFLIVGHLNQSGGQCQCCRRYIGSQCSDEIARWCQMLIVSDESDGAPELKADRWRKI